MKNYDTTFIMDNKTLYKHFLTNIQLLEMFLSNLLSEKAEEWNRNYGLQWFKQHIEKNKHLYKYFNIKDRDENNYWTIIIKIWKNRKYEKVYLDILNKYLIRKNFIYNFYTDMLKGENKY